MNSKKIKFIDLFAGIGGFRLAFESIGYDCVFSAEINPHACEMYKENFGDDPLCDITTLETSNIPDFDLLCAGFPCQAFSISGKQKGFYDDTRGTLFFDICRILKDKKPRAFILENVQNLEKHDNGNTLSVMLATLHQLGYSVNYKVLNAKDFNTPQNRERIILVGCRKGNHFNFEKIKTNSTSSMIEFLDYEGDFEYLDDSEYTLINTNLVKKQKKSGLIFVGYRNKKIRTVGVREGTEHLSRVHKQPNRIYSSSGIHPTIASQETAGRYWIFHNKKVRKLTQNECFRFMGYPENFIKVGTKSKIYERIGNSVCINMIKEIGKEIDNQIFKGEDNLMNEKNPTQFLESTYALAQNKAKSLKNNLNDSQKKWLECIVDNEQHLKGVYTVLVSSLTYKSLYPTQDVRFHKIELPNGYSGRSFDTKFVTPFLKSKKFFGAMKESGWLTRSLEQLHPFDLSFPGRINNKDVKYAFLNILNDIEENKLDSSECLIYLFSLSIDNKSKKTVTLINPITSESELDIDQIISYLISHFYYKYSTRGASILPVVAFYSIYECIIDEVGRYNNKSLDVLASHTSSDRSSKATGDIVIRDENKNIYEVVEIKFDISPNQIMIEDAYEKFKSTSIQRYYILSTIHADQNEEIKINKKINDIRNEHGCQVIVNGIIPSLKYYLRLLQNTDLFIDRYVKNIQENLELDFEHKIAWNRILGKTK